MTVILLLAAGAFAAAAAVDFVWARYLIHVAARRAGKAAGYAFAISCMGIVSFEAWLRHPWLVLATASGSWLGTYLTVKHTAE